MNSGVDFSGFAFDEAKERGFVGVIMNECFSKSTTMTYYKIFNKVQVPF